MAPLLHDALESARHSLSLRSLTTAASSIIPRNQQALDRRQQAINGIIPTYYQNLNSGPAPGAVVGIVLGSVAGFLVIVWLLWALTGNGISANIQGEEEIVVRKSPRSRRSRHSRSTREMREVSRSPRRERIIVEERRTSMAPPPPRSRSRSIIVEERIERERRVPGDDVVEVIEESSDLTPAPRRKSRRNSGYRSVDPNRYAGGDNPQHSVERSRRSS